MRRIEYRTVDKSEWIRGVWDDEPDKVQWQDEATSFPCLIVRGPAGALCGYVGIPKEHPLHGKDYDTAYDVIFRDEDEGVHGGLTFAGPCREASRANWEKVRIRYRASDTKSEAARFPIGDTARWMKTMKPLVNNYEQWVDHIHATHVCHIVEPGENDGVWWFGFDCAHSGDLAPAFEHITRSVHREMGNPHEHDVYRDMAYVTDEVRRLAQLIERITPAGERFRGLIMDEGTK